MNEPVLPRTEFAQMPTVPKSRWHSYLPIVLVTIFGLAVTWNLFRAVAGWERQSVETAFEAAARDRVLVIQREFVHALDVVEDIGSLFDASTWVGRREFRRFVGPALKRQGSIESLEWVPRVAGQQRTEFEEGARRSFPKFRINERNADGDLVRAGQRDVHFPVLYVQPYQFNR
ncbi:MAG: CHASE domain-containing protein, partial [Thiohalobacterales bacterium]|nr:CHASE domain-containing protein [Thiohalobacterales bacterium]